MESRRAPLLDEMAQAFAFVERGDGPTLHEAEEEDSRAPRELREAARARDDDEHWQDVSAQDLIECPFALHFLEPAGLRYYLPAFISFEVRSLAPSAGLKTHLLFHIPKTIWLLSDEQADALYHFLQFLVDFADESVADESSTLLKSYWR